jgi:hypothetical protein
MTSLDDAAKAAGLDDAAKVDLLKQFAETPESRAKLVESMRVPTLRRIEFKGLWKVFGNHLREAPDLDQSCTFSPVIPGSAVRNGDTTFVHRSMLLVQKHVFQEVGWAILAWAHSVAGERIEGDAEPWRDGYLLMNPLTFTEKWRDRQTHKTFYPTCARELIVSGYLGEYHGSDGAVMAVLCDTVVEPGLVYAFGEPGSTARWAHQLDFSYDDEPWRKQDLLEFDAVFRYGLDPEPNPKVRIYREAMEPHDA